VSQGCGRECVGRGVIVERAPSPSTAVYEPLAVLHHEINVMLGTWHHRLSRIRLLFFRVPMDLRHLSAIWERLAIARHAFLIGIDHYWVPHDRSHNALVLTDRDHWPAFVSPELRRMPAHSAPAQCTCPVRRWPCRPRRRAPPQ